MSYPGNGPHPLPPLISIELLETHLQIPLGTLEITYAMSLINGACGAIRDVCHWRIDREVVTNYRPEGDWSRLLLLPTAHLVSVEEVRIDGEVLVPFALNMAWDYSIATRPAALKLRNTRYGWPETEGRIEIDFTHGYLLDYDESLGEFTHGAHSGLPSGLESIILAVAERAESGSEGLASLKVGGITESYAGSGAPLNFVVSNSEREQLAHYIVEL